MTIKKRSTTKAEDEYQLQKATTQRLLAVLQAFRLACPKFEWRVKLWRELTLSKQNR